jgi:hypothetical protein
VDAATDRAQYVTRVEAVGKTCVRVAMPEGAPHAATWGLDGASGRIPGYAKAFHADAHSLLRLRPWRHGDDETAEVYALACALCDITRERWERVGAAYGLAVLRDVARWVGVAVKVEPRAEPAPSDPPRQMKIPGA